MIDIKLVRSDPQKVRQALEDRAKEAPLAELIAKDREWRDLLQRVEEIRKRRNFLSEEISSAKKKGGNASSLLQESKEIPTLLQSYDEQLRTVEEQVRHLSLQIPNIPNSSVPVGKDETQNKLVRSWGKPSKPTFTPKDHHELGEKLGILDFERGALLSGERFTVLKGAASQLSRAIANFMLDSHRPKGYVEVSPPLLVTEKTMTGTGQLPKFEEDLYKLERDNLWAIPTAEVPLTNLHAGQILEYKDLPKYYAAWTPCFRREAGSHGKDTRGIIRQHQFDKVELVKLTHQENSYEELEKLTADAEAILQALNLPYRVMLLSTGDMGFAAAKTYDIEVWLPSQNKYREISSCSNCEEFQSRRMNTKYRGKDNEFHYVHTLNGSALAVGRTLVAIMENYQQADGSILIPEALQPYMGGMKKIS